jgi:hypothetical protein
MKTRTINFVAIAVLAVVHQVLNFGWYTLAGDNWLTLAKITAAQAESTNPLVYLVSFTAIVAGLYIFKQKNVLLMKTSKQSQTFVFWGVIVVCL